LHLTGDFAFHPEAEAEFIEVIGSQDRDGRFPSFVVATAISQAATAPGGRVMQ
jgi:hypothetical protein